MIQKNKEAYILLDSGCKLGCGVYVYVSKAVVTIVSLFHKIHRNSHSERELNRLWKT